MPIMHVCPCVLVRCKQHFEKLCKNPSQFLKIVTDPTPFFRIVVCSVSFSHSVNRHDARNVERKSDRPIDGACVAEVDQFLESASFGESFTSYL